MLNTFAASLLLPPWVIKEITFLRRSNEYALAIGHYQHNLSKMSTNLLVKYYSFVSENCCNYIV